VVNGDVANLLYEPLAPLFPQVQTLPPWLGMVLPEQRAFQVSTTFFPFGAEVIEQASAMVAITG
jgi:hypothetical protein